jgi:uncharacterized protein
MSTRIAQTGWRFTGIGLPGEPGAPHASPGLGLTPAGRIAMVSGSADIRQSIHMLLTTIPGERVMRPDYGCPLHRLMFAPNDPTTAGLAIHYVRQALARFEPRIEIVALDCNPAWDERAPGDATPRLLISLVYRIKAIDRKESLELELALEGTRAA